MDSLSASLISSIIGGFIGFIAAYLMSICLERRKVKQLKNALNSEVLWIREKIIQDLLMLIDRYEHPVSDVHKFLSDYNFSYLKIFIEELLKLHVLFNKDTMNLFHRLEGYFLTLKKRAETDGLSMMDLGHDRLYVPQDETIKTMSMLVPLAYHLDAFLKNPKNFSFDHKTSSEVFRIVMHSLKLSSNIKESLISSHVELYNAVNR